MKQLGTKEKNIVQQTATYIEQKFLGEGTGHDWWHIYRVWQNSIHIAGKETEANLFVVQLAALLHDIADWKFHDGDTKIGGKVAREWLETLAVNESTISAVQYIVDHISFKGAAESTHLDTLEAKIVQDADRLDAIGAIGIARTFAYGGHKNRELYNPNLKPEKDQSIAAYRDSKSHTINHFYEKLLMLKERMNTETGKQIAQQRHEFMELYLEQFYAEWDGKR